MRAFRDNCPACQGRFRLQVFRLGRLVEEMDEDNLVVAGSLPILANLVGGTFTGNNVSQIGFGSNLAQPTLFDTALLTPYIKSLQPPAYPGSGQVQFSFTLLGTEANGLSIGEFGLLTGSGILFARKARSVALAKDGTISLSGTWTLEF